MQNVLFIAVCLAVLVWMIIDSGKTDVALNFWEHVSLPAKEDLAVYFSQGVYYIALLIGMVYLARKFKRRK